MSLAMPLQQPIIDIENPLYCPEVSAHQFLASARLLQASLDDVSRFSFLRKLCDVSTTYDCSDSSSSRNSSTSSYLSTSGTESTSTSTESSVPSALLDSPRGPLADTLLLYQNGNLHINFEEQNSYSDDLDSVSVHLKAKPIFSAGRHSNNTNNHELVNDGTKLNSMADSEQSVSSDTTSDFLRHPFKRLKRSSSIAPSSFVLSTKPEPLRFPLPPKTTLGLLDPVGGSEGWRTSDANIASEGNDAIDEDHDDGSDWFWPGNIMMMNGSKRVGVKYKYKGGTRGRRAISGSTGADPRKGTY